MQRTNTYMYVYIKIYVYMCVYKLYIYIHIYIYIYTFVTMPQLTTVIYTLAKNTFSVCLMSALARNFE